MSTMDMAHWESRRNNEFVESVTYVAYEHIRHNTLFNIIYIMRTVLCGAGGALVVRFRAWHRLRSLGSNPYLDISKA